MPTSGSGESAPPSPSPRALYAPPAELFLGPWQRFPASLFLYACCFKFGKQVKKCGQVRKVLKATLNILPSVSRSPGSPVRRHGWSQHLPGSRVCAQTGKNIPRTIHSYPGALHIRGQQAAGHRPELALSSDRQIKFYWHRATPICSLLHCGCSMLGGRPEESWVAAYKAENTYCQALCRTYLLNPFYPASLSVCRKLNIFTILRCLLKKIYLLIWPHWVFVAVCGLSLVAASGGGVGGVALRGLLTAAASLVAEHRLSGMCASSRRAPT